MASDSRNRESDSTTTVPLSESEAFAALAAEASRVSIVVYHRRGVDAALLGPGRSVVVGRKSPSDLCIDDPALSRQHARFTQVDTHVLVEDLDSTNGTWIAGQRVSQAKLRVGAEAMLGSLIARIQIQGVMHEDATPDGENSFRARLDDEVARARHFNDSSRCWPCARRTGPRPRRGRAGRKPCALTSGRSIASVSTAKIPY